jgi:hypothetical protein
MEINITKSKMKIGEDEKNALETRRIRTNILLIYLQYIDQIPNQEVAGSIPGTFTLLKVD